MEMAFYINIFKKNNSWYSIWQKYCKNYRLQVL